jgi:hypothetical protein
MSETVTRLDPNELRERLIGLVQRFDELRGRL